MAGVGSSGGVGNVEHALNISNAQLQRDRMAVSLPAEITTVRKRKKPDILDEDDYTEAVQKIIERDFFPDLARTRLQVCINV